VDDPPADHLRIRDSAVRCRRRRLLPPFGRWLGRKHAARPACAAGGGRHRVGIDGHAQPAGSDLGVGELEVPEAGQGRRDDLRPLGADPEAAAGGCIAHRHRCLARGRPHVGRGSLRRGRGRGERAPEDGGRRPFRRTGRPGAVAAAPEAPGWRR